WEPASGKLLRRLEHTRGAASAVFSPDGKTLASGGAGLVCLWDVATGKQLRKLESPGGSPLAFSPDGKLLAAGSYDGEAYVVRGPLRLWDLASGTQLHALEHSDPTLAVAFSPDGKTLAAGTRRGTLHLWDAVTGKELRKVNKFAASVLSFSLDGRM